MKTKTQTYLIIALVVLGAVYLVNTLFFESKKSTNFNREIVYFDPNAQDSILIIKAGRKQSLVRQAENTWHLQINTPERGKGALELSQTDVETKINTLATLTASKLAKARVTQKGMNELGLSDSLRIKVLVYQGRSISQEIWIGETKRIKLETSAYQPTITYFMPKDHDKVYATDKSIHFVNSNLEDEFKSVQWFRSRSNDLVVVDIELNGKVLNVIKQSDKWVNKMDTTSVLERFPSTLNALVSSKSTDFSFLKLNSPIGRINIEATEEIDGKWEIFSSDTEDNLWVKQPKEKIAYKISKKWILDLFN